MESAEAVATTARPVSGNNTEHPPLQDARDDQSHARHSRINHPAGNHRQPTRPSSAPKPPRPSQVCRFYGTKKGCRAGDQCPYQHIQARQDPVGLVEATDSLHVTSNSHIRPVTKPAADRQQHRNPVAKPASSLEKTNPREFQISQVVRRYKPFRADLEDVTTLKFKLEPSDPDFPFELSNGLQCVLRVPFSYPQDEKPSLLIQNEDMPRGFQINVEQGFDQLIQQNPRKTLLSLLNDLDKNLERFLSLEKAQTIKITANARKKEAPADVPVEAAVAKPVVVESIGPLYSSEQLANARLTRDVHVRQLENRMSRVPLFWKSEDGMTFNMPLHVAKSASLPTSLQSLKEAILLVPEYYPLEPCTIHLKGIEGEDADNVEMQFEQHARANPALTLMAHINHLTQNIHVMATKAIIKPAPTTDHTEISPKMEKTEGLQSDGSQEGTADPERPHLRFLAHPPPEWNRSGVEQDSSEDEETSDDSYDDTDSEEGEGGEETGGASLPAFSTSNPERGISLSFPGLDLSNIELLQLANLSISVKCDRCKSSVDIQDIKPSSSSPTTLIRRTEICPQCSTPLTITYRPDPLHVNSVKAGYLDLEGCSTVLDMLPSTFLPTCSECSTTASLGHGSVVAVRGDSSFSNCRSCYTKISFKLPEVKFLRVAISASTLLPARKAVTKEKLGVVRGTPLPNNGRCKHYAKSFRWFRFSCCKLVYPCDQCHDEATGAIPTAPSTDTAQQPAATATTTTTPALRDAHRTEHAPRMLCGFCSREQPYAPDACRFCGSSLVKRARGAAGKGFWEGGKGTRDPELMRRKEGRKWKHRGEKKRVETK